MGQHTVAPSYPARIRRLIEESPFAIDTEVEVSGHPPTMASSQFLTNREQGDWAEQIIFDAINTHSSRYRAVRYGRRESLPADHPRFRQHYATYLKELNSFGKKPDLLVFPKGLNLSPSDRAMSDETVRQALAAIEVRSSSFLAEKYARFMWHRNRTAEQECLRLQSLLLTEPYGTLLRSKAPETYSLLRRASRDTFREITFRATRWSSSPALREMSRLLRDLKAQIRILHKRDYLSITPKLEDIALVNRWIQRYGVPHHYLQVFFDKAYAMSFEEILRLVSDPDCEGQKFSVERDVKNQQKTTLKIDVAVGREIVGRIDFPTHESAVRELARGRLLFYVRFRDGRGYLDATALHEEILRSG